MIPVHVLIKTDRTTEIDAVAAVTNALERAGYDVLAVETNGASGSVRMIAVEPDLRDEQEFFALSDCATWETNPYGDCSGRVERVNGVVLCEACRNRVCRICGERIVREATGAWVHAHTNDAYCGTGDGAVAELEPRRG